MVVSATRSAQLIGDVVADVTLIDRETIERAGPVGLAGHPGPRARRPDHLHRRHGREHQRLCARRGKPHTPVFIDGVRVESQATAGGAP